MNHISIYSLFLRCLCNLNARFTPLYVNITLTDLCEFCRDESKVSKEEDKQSKKVEPAPKALLRQGEGIDSPRQRESFAEAKLRTEEIKGLEFAKAKKNLR